jgi:DNA-binding winged helix-turn-helix (wHTH) protein
VITKIELLDRVWDAAADTDPNVVEVYVGYLRRKIDQPYGRHCLQTVRGAGYRFVDDPPEQVTGPAVPVTAAGPGTGPAAYDGG